MSNGLIGTRDIKVVIMMATYNGEKYIKEQIDSIINQSYTNWNLLIRDDLSTDSTFNIIREIAIDDPRIKIVEDVQGNLGQCSNFDSLMKYSIRNYHDDCNFYYMFADQDDFWKPNKIEKSLNGILKVERELDSKVPTMVYTNYEVSDDYLMNPKIAYMREKKYDDMEIASRLLVQNWVMGCTMIINRKLLEISVGIPNQADNHDNWIAKICSLIGSVGYIHAPTMIHRVHTSNVTTSSDTTSFKERVKRLKLRFKMNTEQFKKRKELMRYLEDRISKKMNSETENLFLEYKKMLNSKHIKSIKIAYRNKFFAVNKVQTLLLYIQLLLPRI